MDRGVSLSRQPTQKQARAIASCEPPIARQKLPVPILAERQGLGQQAAALFLRLGCASRLAGIFGWLRLRRTLGGLLTVRGLCIAAYAYGNSIDPKNCIGAAIYTFLHGMDALRSLMLAPHRHAVKLV